MMMVMMVIVVMVVVVDTTIIWFENKQSNPQKWISRVEFSWCSFSSSSSQSCVSSSTISVFQRSSITKVSIFHIIIFFFSLKWKRRSRWYVHPFLTISCVFFDHLMVHYIWFSGWWWQLPPSKSYLKCTLDSRKRLMNFWISHTIWTLNYSW